MLEASGFEVVDLGVDVPKELVLKGAIENKSDIVGLSGPLMNIYKSNEGYIFSIPGK